MPASIDDPTVELEKFVDSEMEATTNAMQPVGFICQIIGDERTNKKVLFRSWAVIH